MLYIIYYILLCININENVSACLTECTPRQLYENRLVSLLGKIVIVTFVRIIRCTQIH